MEAMHTANKEYDEQRERLQRYVSERGRPLRVLHIGNIANNAFHNAKMLRKCGVDVDVACPDYYHIMGCPEWEDADFNGEVDDFKPLWFQLNLHGYRRPSWFVQGPRRLVLNYLLARLDGETWRANCLWSRLSLFNGTRGPNAFDHLRLHARRTATAVNRIRRILLQPVRLHMRLLGWQISVSVFLRRIAAMVARLVRDRRIAAMVVSFVPARRIAATVVRLVPARRIAAMVVRLVRVPAVVISALLTRLLLRFRESVSDDRSSPASFVIDYDRAFPDREDKLSPMDLVPYFGEALAWRPLFDHYDIVQAFATDPIWPMLGRVPYFAFEHGTLREIPFIDDARGRLTALAYHCAEHVFVTNADCMSNARQLAGEKVTFINHPYDEDDALVRGAEYVREQLLSQVGSKFLFFHPTRHDWVPGGGFADKSNDTFLRAFAALRSEGLNVGLVTCKWGRDVAASRQLLAELGVDSFVYWEAPMAGRRFMRVARASDIVVDQFKFSAFGGVTFKALAAGVPVCTRLDERQAEDSFGAPPPVINCSNVEELLTELRTLIGDPIRLSVLGKESRQWIERYHSGRAVAAAHLRVYLDFLERREEDTIAGK
jgi:glycosyltransferase involved in cell wall biosynthesis